LPASIGIFERIDAGFDGQERLDLFIAENKHSAGISMHRCLVKIASGIRTSAID
jgi:hypothetical protein